MPEPRNTDVSEVVEPDNSTVDDWFGQNVARDQDVADQAMADAGGDAGKAEEFEREAEGEDRYRSGHPRRGSS